MWSPWGRAQMIGSAERWLSLFCLAFVASCGSPSTVEPAPTVAKVWWEGDLAELDGERVSSGIKIEIESDGEPNGGAVRYRIKTGCQASGVVSPTGEVQANELLRPCLEADVSRMDRLSDISPAALTAASALNVTLQWNDREAVLSSEAGEARFTAVQSQPIGAAASAMRP